MAQEEARSAEQNQTICLSHSGSVAHKTQMALIVNKNMVNVQASSEKDSQDTTKLLHLHTCALQSSLCKMGLSYDEIVIISV